MKKYKNIITILIVGLVLLVGINVNASEKRYNGYTVINVPIHKTDEQGNPLEGVEFTLTGLNSEEVSYKSTYEKNGDYLIKEATDVAYYNPDDYYWYNEEDDEVNNIIDLIPEKYQNMIKNIKSWDDVVELADSQDYPVYQYSSTVEISLLVPVIVKETKVPAGYEKQNIVIPANVFIYFYQNDINGGTSQNRTDYEGDLNDIGIDISSYIYIYPDNLYYPAGYFTYQDGVDYVEIFDKVNKQAAKTINNGTWGYVKYVSILKKEGFNVDKADCSKKEEYEKDFEPIADKRTELRLDEDITNTLCILQIENKKEQIIVNPETYGTVVIVLILAFGATGLLFSKKLKNQIN